MTTEVAADAFLASAQRDIQPGVERLEQFVFNGNPLEVKVGLPENYDKKKSNYPLLVILDGDRYGSGAIDIARLMADTDEVKPCIVVAVGFAGNQALRLSAYLEEGSSLSSIQASGLGCDNTVTARASRFRDLLVNAILPWCLSSYRVDNTRISLFGHGVAGGFVLKTLFERVASFTQFVSVSPALALLPPPGLSAASLATLAHRSETLLLVMGSHERYSSASQLIGAHRTADFYRQIEGLNPALPVGYREIAGLGHSAIAMPALASFLLQQWPTGKVYGAAAKMLAKPWVNRAIKTLRPVLARFSDYGQLQADQPCAALIHCEALQRNFEVRIALPESAAEQPARRYPVLLVLDSNYAFNFTADAARTLAASGDCEEVIVVGLGVPLREGSLTFALRRLQEFSPPDANYHFQDELGRILSSLYALAGLNVRQFAGKADVLYRFIVDRLLPQLTSSLPLDPDRIGLFGHSAGGTFAAYALQQPDSPFDDYLISSPGLGISDSWLLKQKQLLGKTEAYPDVIVSIGTEEFHNYFNQAAGIPEAGNYAEQLASTTASCLYLKFNNETHSSVLPRALYQAMMVFYAGQISTASAKVDSGALK